MYTVIEKEIVLSPLDEKTNVPVAFSLNKPAELLKITYSYFPKKLEDEQIAKDKIIKCLITDGAEEKIPEWKKFVPLSNLVTLSLDDPFTFRGAAHRQAHTQEHIISETQASVGFIKGKLPAGEWLLQLNVHALVTEKCVCSIKVEVEDKVYE